LFFGFSDITALQLSLWHKASLISYSGIQGSFMEKPLSQTMYTLFQACLAHEPITFTGMSPVTKGTASGPLLGGTLTLTAGLIGTPYMPDFTGALLVIEEVGEEPYRIDRLLTQLRLAGVFNQVGGIILAGFHNCVSKDPADGTIEQVLSDHFNHSAVPVIRDFPYGHGINQAIFPIGVRAELNADKGVLKINEYDATNRTVGTGR
ncbi:MAG: LD-carboxypeptidase, partial [Alphaproteobacteria bacterium]